MSKDSHGFFLFTMLGDHASNYESFLPYFHAIRIVIHDLRSSEHLPFFELHDNLAIIGLETGTTPLGFDLYFSSRWFVFLYLVVNGGGQILIDSEMG